MESISFFEKKINLNPYDFNKIKSKSIDDIILEKAKELMEGKCSENGYVLPGFLELVSRSMGRFEDGNKTGDATYYVKLKGKIIYPADGVRVKGKVIRKNKMGLYVEYNKAIRVQVPRDFHVGSEEYDSVEVDDIIEVELKRSKFQINDKYILASGIFISKESDKAEEEEEEETETEAETEAETETETEAEEEAETETETETETEAEAEEEEEEEEEEEDEKAEEAEEVKAEEVKAEEAEDAEEEKA